MSIQDTLADIVSRLETSHACLHPATVTTIPKEALFNLASAVLQIHNTTTNPSTMAAAATALKAIEGGT